MALPPLASARQYYNADVEKAVNQQINNELRASYIYLAMASHFNHVEVAMPGAAAFFAHQSKEETQHAQKLIDYQNARGGRVQLMELEAPTNQRWEDLHSAFVDALRVEKDNNTALIKLHKMADEKQDRDLTNFLEEFYLREQVDEIQMMARYANQLRRVGPGLGEHLFDRELLAEMNDGGDGGKSNGKSERE